MEPCRYDRETILANLAPYPYGEHNPCPYGCFDTEEDEKRRLDSIVSLVTTMPSMGLQDHLAFDFFKKFYVSSMIGHETVRGFAEDNDVAWHRGGDCTCGNLQEDKKQSGRYTLRDEGLSFTHKTWEAKN